MYGFRRLTQGADAGAYYHELFLRGRPQLCMRMQRQKVKGTGHKQPADAKTEPNFYNMPPSDSPQAPPSPPPNEFIRPFTSSQPEELSPGMRGLHGAAHMLKNIASGVRAPTLGSNPFSLGASAIGSSSTQNMKRESRAQHSSSYDPLLASKQEEFGITSPPLRINAPPSDPSMSLLGRVNMNESSASSPRSMSSARQSAFFWPVVRSFPGEIQRNVSQEEDTRREPGQTDLPLDSTTVEHDISQGEFQEEPSNLETQEEDTSPDSWESEQSFKDGKSLMLLRHTKGNLPVTPSLSNESGPMETKVANGIETEEV